MSTQDRTKPPPDDQFSPSPEHVTRVEAGRLRARAAALVERGAHEQEHSRLRARVDYDGFPRVCDRCERRFDAAPGRPEAMFEASSEPDPDEIESMTDEEIVDDCQRRGDKLDAVGETVRRLLLNAADCVATPYIDALRAAVRARTLTEASDAIAGAVAPAVAAAEAEIVAWLRDRPPSGSTSVVTQLVHSLADAIERGDHRRKP